MSFCVTVAWLTPNHIELCGLFAELNRLICLTKRWALHFQRKHGSRFISPSAVVSLIGPCSLQARQVVYNDNECLGGKKKQIMNASEIIRFIQGWLKRMPLVCVVNLPYRFQGRSSYSAPPHGRWGRRCVRAGPQQLAHGGQEDKVWRPGHADARSCPGTKQRHASLWTCRGAQTTFLRWGWWHTVFQKQKKEHCPVW